MCGTNRTARATGSRPGLHVQGRADVVRVVIGLDSGLDRNAVEAVKQWKFEPGNIAGKLVRLKATIEVNFRPR